MNRRFSSLVLLLVLIGGAFAAVPLSFGESECGMGTMNMDCCKAALLQKDKARFTVEEDLLCAINCAQNGTTLPTSVVRVTPPTQTIEPSHPASTRPLTISLSVSRTATRAHSPPPSQPTYLRNLALLI